MANKGPEYFYHPAVGVISPASLELFRLNAAKTAPLPAAPLSEPAPSTPASVPSAVLPVQAQLAAPVADKLPPNTLLPSLSAPRKLMTLSRTELCVVTGETVPLPDLIRFVIDPDKRVVPDLAEKLPGQYFYIRADRSTIQKAIWRNTFTSVAKDAVTVPDNLLEVIETGLTRMALDCISLSKRSGALLAGFASIEDQLRAKPEGVYVVAADASDHGRHKLAKLGRDLPVLDLWSSADLSAAIGEANTNHLLLGPGGLTEKLLRLSKKLQAVRSDR